MDSARTGLLRPGPASCHCLLAVVMCVFCFHPPAAVLFPHLAGQQSFLQQHRRRLHDPDQQAVDVVLQVRHLLALALQRGLQPNLNTDFQSSQTSHFVAQTRRCSLVGLTSCSMRSSLDCPAYLFASSVGRRAGAGAGAGEAARPSAAGRAPGGVAVSLVRPARKLWLCSCKKHLFEINF